MSIQEQGYLCRLGMAAASGCILLHVTQYHRALTNDREIVQTDYTDRTMSQGNSACCVGDYLRRMLRTSTYLHCSQYLGPMAGARDTMAGEDQRLGEVVDGPEAEVRGSALRCILPTAVRPTECIAVVREMLRWLLYTLISGRI